MLFLSLQTLPVSNKVSVRHCFHSVLLMLSVLQEQLRGQQQPRELLGRAGDAGEAFLQHQQEVTSRLMFSYLGFKEENILMKPDQ